MGRSHGSTRQRGGGGVAADVRGQNTDTGGKDVDTSAVVGKATRAEGAVRRRDGDGVGGVGGGLARDGERAAGLITVAGSDDGKNALGVGGLNGVGPGG